MSPRKIADELDHGIARGSTGVAEPARLDLSGPITSFFLVTDSRNSGMCGTGNRPDTGAQITFTSRSEP